jgi:hypothetical protein
MPNYCSNTLTLKGKAETLKLFNSENSEGDKGLTFNKKVTRPATQEENWYSWNCSNWGTKWDISGNASITQNSTDKPSENGDAEITYSFDTAWTPPTEWVYNVSRFYPEIEFELDYEEPGVDFAGRICIRNGAPIDEETWQPSVQEKEDFYLEHVVTCVKLGLDPYNFYDYYSNKLLKEEIDKKFEKDEALINQEIEDIASELEKEGELSYMLDPECVNEGFQEWYKSYIEDWYAHISKRKLGAHVAAEISASAIEMNHRPLKSGFLAAKEEFESCVKQVKKSEE